MSTAPFTFLQIMSSPLTSGGSGEHLPFEWIEQAVQSVDGASIRRRRLPAEQVVWFIVAVAQ